jgi:hypothetical protein
VFLKGISPNFDFPQKVDKIGKAAALVVLMIHLLFLLVKSRNICLDLDIFQVDYLVLFQKSFQEVVKRYFEKD